MNNPALDELLTQIKLVVYKYWDIAIQIRPSTDCFLVANLDLRIYPIYFDQQKMEATVQFTNHHEKYNGIGSVSLEPECTLSPEAEAEMLPLIEKVYNLINGCPTVTASVAQHYRKRYGYWDGIKIDRPSGHDLAQMYEDRYESQRIRS